ncbi:MAG: patatin-like phospholipase family protein [Kiritimatiellae bacterium]|nr:patatin-like phospholipase family protein [Kiritimatiellia bacterium]
MRRGGKKYRILSLDGGGIRGLLAAILLERLEQAVPGWLERVELLAGTSTGGILALGLAHGLSPSDLRELYEKKGREIFDDSWLDDLRDLGRLVGAEYGNRNLARELTRLFGDTRLEDLEKRVLIPAFDLDNEKPDPGQRSWAPKFFHNFSGPDSDGAQPVWKVALYTSAAPAYFPSVDGYIDGGVAANNPAMAALAQTRDRRAFARPPPLDSVVLLSMGTGRSLMRIEGKNLNWGYAQWARPILDILGEGLTGVADYQCRQMLAERYHRLAPVFPAGERFPLDGVKRIPDLVAFAGGVDLSSAIAWLRRAWE